MALLLYDLLTTNQHNLPVGTLRSSADCPAIVVTATSASVAEIRRALYGMAAVLQWLREALLVRTQMYVVLPRFRRLYAFAGAARYAVR